MTETATENQEFEGAGDESDEAGVGDSATLYGDAVEEYLAAAPWLGPADAPLKVHARSIAKSLDRQLVMKGEVQSALASSFDKVLLRLDKRRPPPAPAPPRLGDSDGNGTPSMFPGYLE